jgi:Fis family transcriptional regulator
VVHIALRNKCLSTLTDEALHGYFANLNGHKPADLYQLVIGEVEKPLFSVVLDYTNGNQSEAAEILGINRGTLRKKLKAYKLTSG